MAAAQASIVYSSTLLQSVRTGPLKIRTNRGTTRTRTRSHIFDQDIHRRGGSPQLSRYANQYQVSFGWSFDDISLCVPMRLVENLFTEFSHLSFVCRGSEFVQSPGFRTLAESETLLNHRRRWAVLQQYSLGHGTFITAFFFFFAESFYGSPPNVSSTKSPV